MAVATVQFHSAALGKSATYNVLLPDQGDGQFPVLMQLHGLSNDAHAWIQRSNIVRYVEALPLIVVLPDGSTSGYLNWSSPDRLGRLNYEDFLIDDIPAHLSRHFQIRPGPWAIGGLSMGGYGAMRLGLKYPDRFASIWSHSSAFHLPNAGDRPFLVDPDDADVFGHATRAATASTRPAIGFDCGVDDVLIEINRSFHCHLTELGVPHHYAEHPGAHDWTYWDEHVQDALSHHLHVLGVA